MVLTHYAHNPCGTLASPECSHHYSDYFGNFGLSYQLDSHFSLGFKLHQPSRSNFPLPYCWCRLPSYRSSNSIAFICLSVVMSILIVESLSWVWLSPGPIAGLLWDFPHTTLFMAVPGYTLTTWSSLLLIIICWHGAPCLIYSDTCLALLSFLLTWGPGLGLACWFPDLPK